MVFLPFVKMIPSNKTHTAALEMILRTWGARITWTAQREHASQILRGMQAFHDLIAFTRGWGVLGGIGDGGYTNLRALINFGDPKTYYIFIMAWFFFSL